MGNENNGSGKCDFRLGITVLAGVAVLALER